MRQMGALTYEKIGGAGTLWVRSGGECGTLAGCARYFDTCSSQSGADNIGSCKSSGERCKG
ncbi:hypothetical protein GCM10010862_07750 [Devosia nitrariae]|uniref:Uncharacterized protein n=1 Tax=Devosia nitrariae TaxID=2071872 RepID=A0ABQ5W136_9HYPH|nr:hypothetical protein GCM10010862_07750 [Devosia nitrariae]